MKRVFQGILIAAGILFVLFLAACVYAVGVTAGVRLDAEKLTLSTACVRLFDADGEQIETAQRRNVSIDDLPSYVPNAFVAVEDKRFYTHNGLDYRRICAAFLKNIKSFSFREGASTISQQLIKNTHLSSEKTIARKLREIKLTRRLEKKYSKREILELYLNSIYFGHDAFGIADASVFYFGKEAEELTPSEAATLAALVRSPNRYSPFKDAETCRSRRDFVLSLMVGQGYLDENAYQTALEEPLPALPAQRKGSDSYLEAVFGELSEILPDWKEMGSLKIHTYLDSALQRSLCETEADCDVCIAVEDNAAHAMKALYSTCGTPKRLPASTLKPLLVYGPAIEEDYICPATPILDEKTDFGGYCPDDAGGASGEYMSARYALSHSVNIPAVKLLNTIGCEKAAKYLEKMGLHVDESDYSLALALGGMREGLPLTALADAYTTFANGGMFTPSRTIERIENEKGKTVYSRSENATRVFSEETSYLLSDMLKTAATEGTARALRSLPFPVYAKTGTAEGFGGNTDAYTISYTSEDTVAVWMGNRDNSPFSVTGGGLPANLARETLKKIYADHTPAAIPQCDGVEELAYDRKEYETNHRVLLADPLAPLATDRKELFKKNTPLETSTRYSLPRIDTPTISVKNGTVSIVLCQTEYYDYLIKRENRGEIATIYHGKYQKIICDNSVRAGESYRYSVTPLYRGTEGETVFLPLVRIESETALPDNWWD